MADAVVPPLVLKQQNIVLTRRGVVVGAREMAPCPLKRGICVVSFREREARPRFDRMRAFLHFVAIVANHGAGDRVLKRVAAHFMIEHHVRDDVDLLVLERANRAQVLRLRSVFCTPAAFWLNSPKSYKSYAPYPTSKTPPAPLVAGGIHTILKPVRARGGSFVCQFFIQSAIGRQIPLKVLDHRFFICLTLPHLPVKKRKTCAAFRKRFHFGGCDAPGLAPH